MYICIDLYINAYILFDDQVGAGLMSVGDLVAINSMLLQLAIPFNFMGYTCKYINIPYASMNTSLFHSFISFLPFRSRVAAIVCGHGIHAGAAYGEAIGHTGLAGCSPTTGN